MLSLTRDFWKYRSQIVSYCKECETVDSELVPNNIWFVNPFEDFELFMRCMTLPPTEDTLSAEIFLCVDADTDTLVGVVDLREGSIELLRRYGHIGYSVRPSWRHKGIAVWMVQESLARFKSHHIQTVYIACNSQNHASKHVIERTGGTLFNSYIMDGETYLVYEYGAITTAEGFQRTFVNGI